MKIISENNLNMNLLNLSLNKSGIYLITNLVNGKKYVGSSVVLKRRFKEYSNPLYITRNLKRGNSKLLNALLKYGYLNFEFKILETIEFLPSKTKSERSTLLLEREQYYMDLLKPEYNIVKTAGSTVGYKHTPESLEKMRAFVLSDEVKEKKTLAAIKAGAAVSLVFF